MKENSLKIIQSSMPDINISIIINLNNSYYIINCPDGTQRNLIENNIKFNKVKTIFITNPNPSNLSGLFGFTASRTEQSSGFLLGHDLLKPSKEDKENKLKEETSVQIWSPVKGKDFFLYSNDFYIDDPMKDLTIFNNINQYFISDSLNIFPIRLTAKDYIEYSSYLIIPYDKKRPFLINKAKDLGITNTKDISNLNKGIEVTINGRLINPNDLFGDAQKGNSILVLTIETYEDIDYILSNSDENLFSQLENAFNLSKFKNNILKYCIILLGDWVLLDVLQNNKVNLVEEMLIYLKSKIEYMIIDNQYLNDSQLLNKGKFNLSLLTSYISKHNFKVSSCENKEKSYEIQLLKSFLLKENIILSSSYLEVFFFNHNHCNNKNFITLSNKDKENQVNSFTNKYNFEKYSSTQEILLKSDPEVFFIGTSSQKPSIYRNVSGILLQINGKFLVLDTGEGSYQQIYHLYNYERSKVKSIHELLLNTKVIYITHKHGDHFFGILTYLDKIYNVKKAKGVLSNPDYITYIICPLPIIKWVNNQMNLLFNTYTEHSFILLDSSLLNPELIKHYSLFENKDLKLNDDFHFKEDIPQLEYDEIERRKERFLNKINSKENEKGNVFHFYQYINNQFNINIFSIEVLHCNDSYGIIIEDTEKEWKISYSGDTFPCNNFYNYAQFSTLLIHEATFDNELYKEAALKRHSTFKMGIDIGNNSWRKVLTHFSPRYNKEIEYNRELFYNSKTVLAYDGLQFYMSELEDLYKLSPLLNEILVQSVKEGLI